MYHRLTAFSSTTRILRSNMWFRMGIVAAFCSIVLLCLVTVPPGSFGATPAGQTLSETNARVTWTGPLLPATAGGCGTASNSSCDNFKLTIAPPSAAFGPYIVEIRLQPVGDWDLEVYDPIDRFVKGSGAGPNNVEIVKLYNPPAGTYTIAAAAFAPLAGPDTNGDGAPDSYSAFAELKKQPPNAASATGSEAPTYTNYAWPDGGAIKMGEPSIGVNWKTGKVMYAGGGTLRTLRVSFDDSTSPATATWDNVSHIWTTSTRLFADPILFTDRETGRTFAGQLEGLTPFSTTSYTDDDGANWLPSQGSGIASGIDHQTIGGGRLHAPLTRDPNLSRPAYPNGVYYCAQELVAANCALSLDGGQTFGPSVTMYTSECGGLHGHVKVGPDGTVFVPNRGCNGEQGMAVSEDNGVSWAVRVVPGTGGGESDPSVAIATDGTVYLAFQDADGHPKAAVSHDKGLTWARYANNAAFQEVAAPLSIQNTAFPAMVAGDGDRAAYAFLGTSTAGPMQDSSFTGVWNLYVAYTYDGGQTWTTVNATPNDPVQRGCIWMGGGSVPCRNLLDFMDASIDKTGRVLVGYADGCTGACVDTNDPNLSRAALATIARQSTGKGLFAASDPGGGPTPTPTPTPISDGPQVFQGTYDPNPYPCATQRHHFNVSSGKTRIVVQVNAKIISNDLSVSLLYGSDPNPVLVQKTEDTGTCCEVLLYQPAGGVPAGEYQVQICQTPTPQGVPQTPPYDYVGTFTADNTGASTVSPTPTPTPLPTPIPVYQKGGIQFSPNVALRAPVASKDGEPSLRVDRFGNAYVAGIRGVPAGVDLWYFDLNPNSPNYDPLMRNPIYRGQPDQFSPDESVELGADGGGDVDLAVGFDESSAGNPPYLAFSSLTAANISTARSTDRGQTFSKNPAGNVTGGLPADDRQWMEFYGKNSVYLLYRLLDPVIAFVQRSDDGGLTYGPAREVGTIGQVGGISVDQSDGTVYVSGANGVVAVGVPSAPGMEPTSYTIHNVAGSGNAHLFFTVKAAKDGTVYACYSNGSSVFIKYSKDKGNNWSPAVRVSDGAETATSIVPWMETGPTPGSIGVVWYGTTATSNNDNADWKVFFAQSLNATDLNPVFRQVELSDHFIHGSNISESGLPLVPGAAPNRNLLDYFQIGFDPTGAAVVAYTDDHNDFDGHVYVSRQTGGPGVRGANVPLPVEGNALPAPTTRAATDPQVVDYAQDMKTGLLTVLPLNDPLDILSVRYSTEGSASSPVLVATMKVSDLSVVPPLSNWRMNFTANAPDSRLTATGDYSAGLSDRGDQFFVRATTDALGGRTYTYGAAVREHQHRGLIAYTDLGAADSGAFDPAAGTITIKVSLSKLNATLASGHAPIGPGSILAGLRGGAYTTGDDNAADRNDRAKSDITRGGIQYAINSAPTASLTANPLSGAPPLNVNFDGSASQDPDAGDTLTYTFDFGDGSSPVTQASPTIGHAYNQLGTYTATLTVTDGSGFASNAASVRIDVVNRAPSAALSAAPTNGYAPLPVNFDASGSTDPDAGDTIASYRFEFGDGAVVTQTGPKVAHTYNTSGIFTASVSVADNHGERSTNAAQVQITVSSRPTTECMEDDDGRISYSDGWHLGTSTNASAGHFRWHTGKSASHSASVAFTVPANSSGLFTYRYGKSTKGGSAEVFIDGISRGSISFKGSAGSDKSPEFSSGGNAYEARYDGLAPGQHSFELRNLSDSVFVDGFCLTITTQPQAVTGNSTGGTTPTNQSSFAGTPASGPGQTTSNDSAIAAGQQLISNVSLGTDARGISVVAETGGDLPVKLLLVNPSGVTLQIVDSVNGVAVLNAPITQGGLYTIKVVNVNLGPVQVWTVNTPTVAK